MTIGILTTRLPINNMVAPLLGEIPLLAINRNGFLPDGETDSASITSVRVSNQIILLHTIAPAAHLYLYSVPQDVVNPAALADELTKGAAVLQSSTLPGASDFPPVQVIANLVANPLLGLNDTFDLLNDFMADENVLWLNAAGEFGHSHIYLELTSESINPFTDWVVLPPGFLRVPDSGYTIDNQFIPFTRLDKSADVILNLLWTTPGEFTLYVVDDPITQNRIPAPVEIPRPGITFARVELNAEEDTFYVAIEHSGRDNIQEEGEAHLYSYNAVTALTDNSVSIPPPNDYAGAITIGALWPDETPDNLQPASGRTRDKPEIMAYGSFGENDETSSGYATLVTAGVATIYYSSNLGISRAALTEKLIPTSTSAQLRIEPVPYDWQQWVIIPIICLMIGLGLLIIGLLRRRLLRQSAKAALQKIASLENTCKVNIEKTRLTIVFDPSFIRLLLIIVQFKPRLLVVTEFSRQIPVNQDIKLTTFPSPKPANSQELAISSEISPIKEILGIFILVLRILQRILDRPTTSGEISGIKEEKSYLQFNLWMKRFPRLRENENLGYIYEGIQWDNPTEPGNVRVIITSRLGEVFNRELTPEVQ
ncbi:hypothetical protein G4Y79_04520 [Phototrophicus methaneseepsis]|uniref:Uncharacterized protein n=1 Tax=Phototrophicus methaneseepsis TaxID=2710758 RepID=A0A7S8EB19_9CHLR|nr:hypothetical protein [Phototrophicus methaneseepsis]QPC83651.1 hypothetical protein G4Y79_04520 [Phototrophicus methaneseepsis]